MLEIKRISRFALACAVAIAIAGCSDATGPEDFDPVRTNEVAAEVLATFDDGTPAAIEHSFGKGKAITFAFDIGLIANNVTVEPIYQWWSDLLTSLGCRKAIDTGNWHVEGGVWRDDSGNRLVILINHDDERPQKAKLPDGKTVELEPSGTKMIVIR